MAKRWNDKRLRDCAFAFLATQLDRELILKEYEISEYELDSHIEAAESFTLGIHIDEKNRIHEIKRVAYNLEQEKKSSGKEIDLFLNDDVFVSDLVNMKKTKPKKKASKKSKK